MGFRIFFFFFRIFLIGSENRSVVSDSAIPWSCNPPGSSVHGISQARILGWVAIPFSRGSPRPGIEPGCPALQADSLPLSHQELYTELYAAAAINHLKQGTGNKNHNRGSARELRLTRSAHPGPQKNLTAIYSKRSGNCSM